MVMGSEKLIVFSDVTDILGRIYESSADVGKLRLRKSNTAKFCGILNDLFLFDKLSSQRWNKFYFQKRYLY